MKCRGEDTRRRMVKTYQLQPIAHVRLLAGQTKQSCTGDLLTDAYYCFSYKARSGPESGTFFCGEHAAHDFLTLLGVEPLPLFDPLRHAGNDAPGGRIAEGAARQPQRDAWHPAARQLYNAVNLLVVCWNTVPGPRLADIRQRLERFRDRPPFPEQIEKVNYIISRDARGRTLTDMLNELAADNNLRPYRFDLLNEVLAESEIESRFG